MSRDPKSPARATRELPCGRRRLLDDRRDVLEGHGEHVVQHEGEPLGGRERVEDGQERHPDRVREDRLLLRVTVRHTAATLMLSRGVHPKIVAECLGHSTPMLTLTVYSHVTPTMQRGAADELDALLSSRS